MMGLLGIFIPTFLFAIAITELKSSVTGVLNATTPLLTLLIGVIIFSITLRKAQLIGLIIGFIGAIGINIFG